jgi:hypothetical protein
LEGAGDEDADGAQVSGQSLREVVDKIKAVANQPGDEDRHPPETAVVAMAR